jgi:hypothetical protein
MKAVSIVTKEYWISGIEQVLAIWMCPTIRTGTRMIKPRLEKVIFGSAPNYLYSKSFQSTPALIDANLFITGYGVLSSSNYSFTSFSFRVCLELI